MSIAAALLLIAQAATPGAATTAEPRTVPIAERVTASVTVLRPARISAKGDEGTISVEGAASDQSVQRSRDAAGTLWIEFS